MKFNVGIKDKGYCFVELPDMTYDEYMNGALAHEKVMDAIREKYGTGLIVGYAPVKENEDTIKGLEELGAVLTQINCGIRSMR